MRRRAPPSLPTRSCARRADRRQNQRGILRPLTQQGFVHIPKPALGRLGNVAPTTRRDAVHQLLAPAVPALDLLRTLEVPDVVALDQFGVGLACIPLVDTRSPEV